MAILQVTGQPALVKNWRILLLQSFTALIPLLTASSAFGWIREKTLEFSTVSTLSHVAKRRV